MIHRVARFRVREDRVERADHAIQRFVAEVLATERGTLRYDSYREDDGRTYVHFMTFQDDQAEAEHRETPHVQEFVQELYPLCEIEPEFTPLDLVAGAAP